jgi:multidrug efflux pump subunit AcrA (membrane-fusion protein)
MARTAAVAVLLLLVAGGAGAASPGGFSGRGMIRPEAEIVLASRTGGLVNAVSLVEGETVGAGEAIVLLEDAEEASRAAIAKVDLESAEIALKKLKDGPRPEDLARAEALFEESRAGLVLAEKTLASDLKLAEGGILSELGRQRSERALEAARAQTESRRLDLVILKKGTRAEDLRLAEIEVERRRAQHVTASLEQSRRRIAPSRKGRGLVSRVWAEPGQWVDAGRPLAEVVYLDRVRVELDLPGPGALSIPRGAKATVRSPAFPGSALEGMVERVSPVVDAASGTVRVVVFAANPGHAVRSGVEAEVEIAP